MQKISLVIILVYLYLIFPAGLAFSMTSEISPVGFSEKEQKLYYLESFISEDRLPQLYYYKLDSPNPINPIKVKSWYEPEARDQFPERLKKLKERLGELESSDLVGFEVRQKILAREPCVQQEIRWENWCRVIDVTFTFKKLKRTLRFWSWGSGDLVGAWKIPKSDSMFVVYRHKGYTVETGYFKDIPLLMVKESKKKAKKKKWSVNCKKNKSCKILIGKKVVADPGRGKVKCKANGWQVACIWTHTNGAYQSGWFLHLYEGRAIPFPMPVWGGGKVMIKGPKWKKNRILLVFRRDSDSELLEEWRVGLTR